MRPQIEGDIGAKAGLAPPFEGGLEAPGLNTKELIVFLQGSVANVGQNLVSRVMDAGQHRPELISEQATQKEVWKPGKDNRAMKKNDYYRQSSTMPFMRWLMAALLAFALAACATGPKLVNHGFSFDGQKDGWADSVDLLAYSYGGHGSQANDDISSAHDGLLKGKSGLPSTHRVYGAMPVGAPLLVKWRLKSTGEIVEKRVDLIDRLPADMADHDLTFVINERELFVYVVTPQDRKQPARSRTHKNWASQYKMTFEVFPSPYKK